MVCRCVVCRCGLSSPELIKAEYEYAHICSCLICSCLVHGQILLKQVTLRHAKSHAHPSLRNLKLEHNHAIDREAMAVKMRLAGKLTGEMQGQVVKLTGEQARPQQQNEYVVIIAVLNANERSGSTPQLIVPLLAVRY